MAQDGSGCYSDILIPERVMYRSCCKLLPWWIQASKWSHRNVLRLTNWKATKITSTWCNLDLMLVISIVILRGGLLSGARPESGEDWLPSTKTAFNCIVLDKWPVSTLHNRKLKVLSHRFFGRFSNCVETTCWVWIMQAGAVRRFGSQLKQSVEADPLRMYVWKFASHLSIFVLCHSREQILLCKQRLTMMYGRAPCLTWASFCSTSISGRSPSEFEAEKEFRAHLPFQSLVLMTSSLFITKLDPCRWPLGWASSI